MRPQRYRQDWQITRVSASQRKAVYEWNIAAFGGKERKSPNMAKNDTPKYKRMSDVLSLNPFEQEGLERIEWEDMLDTEIVVFDYALDMTIESDGVKVRHRACFAFAPLDGDTEPDEATQTTLIWSQVIHDQLNRIGKDNLPLIGVLKHLKSGTSKFKYVAFQTA